MTDEWTVHTAREHVLALIAELDRRYEQRFADSQSAVDAALDAAKAAVAKAEAAMEKRFDNANEFRGQLSDQARSFMPRAEAETAFRTAEERTGTENANMGALIGSLASRLDRLEGHSGGIRDGWGVLIGIVGMAAGVVAIVVTLIR